MMSRWVVLACSKRKCTERNPLPAIERYDGPMFWLLRRYLLRSQDHPRVYVLSAEYGLIEGGQLIPYYDCRMTPKRARALRPQVAAALKRILTDEAGQGEVRHDVFLNLGRTYSEAVEYAYEWMMHEHNVTCATGSPGSRLAQMHTWLYGAQSLQRADARSRPRQGRVKLRGVEIDLDAEQVMKVAHEVLLSERAGASTSALTWYVTVGEHRVGPKWLMSKVTGLPVSAFHTDEARRVLKQLGVDVQLNVKR